MKLASFSLMADPPNCRTEIRGRSHFFSKAIGRTNLAIGSITYIRVAKGELENVISRVFEFYLNDCSREYTRPNKFMKINIKFNQIKEIFYLDITSWIIFGIAVAVDLVLWYLWRYVVHFSAITMYFSAGVLMLNVILSFMFSKKDNLIPYFLLSTALLVQAFVIILLKYSNWINY